MILVTGVSGADKLGLSDATRLQMRVVGEGCKLVAVVVEDNWIAVADLCLPVRIET